MLEALPLRVSLHKKPADQRPESTPATHSVTLPSLLNSSLKVPQLHTQSLLPRRLRLPLLHQRPNEAWSDSSSTTGLGSTNQRVRSHCCRLLRDIAGTPTLTNTPWAWAELKGRHPSLRGARPIAECQPSRRGRRGYVRADGRLRSAETRRAAPFWRSNGGYRDRRGGGWGGGQPGDRLSARRRGLPPLVQQHEAIIRLLRLTCERTVTYPTHLYLSFEPSP